MKSYTHADHAWIPEGYEWRGEWRMVSKGESFLSSHTYGEICVATDPSHVIGPRIILYRLPSPTVTREVALKAMMKVWTEWGCDGESIDDRLKRFLDEAEKGTT